MNKTTCNAAGAVLIATMVLGVLVDLADAGTRRRRDRIEELVETVRGIERKVAEASGAVAAVKKNLTPAKSAYERAHAEIGSIDAELDETRKQISEMNRKRIDLIKHVTEQLDELPEVKKAREAVKVATEKLNDAKTKALKPLTENARYQSLARRIKDASENLQTLLREGANPADLSTLRLNIAKDEQELRSMVDRMLSASGGYRIAKSELDEAEKKYKALLDAHEAELKNHPERVAMDNAIEDLRKKQGDLQRKLIAARRAEAKAKPKYAFYAAQMAKAEKELDHQRTLLSQAEDLLRDARAGG